MLNVNTTDDNHARYTAWYHNGTTIVSGNKYVIENTTLIVNNIAENDAGKYEVKINSISSDSDRSNSPECDSLVLPLLEAQAAPVTFMVQEQFILVYDPSSIVSTHYVTNDTDDIHRIELRSAPLNSSLFGSVSSYLYKNGIRTSTGDSQEELSLMYNNTATVIGDYVRVLWLRSYSQNFVVLCGGYYYYLDNNFFTTDIPLQVSFWSIKYYSEFEASTAV